MEAGEVDLSSRERAEIDRAVRAAETLSRLEFSVFLGRADEESRPFAERLHAALTAPDISVLVMVDPSARLLEVVTGRLARQRLTDQEVGLAVTEMQASFAGGDVAGGLRRGLQLLAEHARRD